MACGTLILPVNTSNTMLAFSSGLRLTLFFCAILFCPSLSFSPFTSAPNLGAHYTGPFQLAGTELLHLRVLVDKSVVEVFANDRQAALRRIYPSNAESVQVKLFSEGGATRVHRLTGWEMMPSNPY